MTKANDAKKIIRTLEQGGFYAQCPACEESFKIKDAQLFYLDDFPEQAEEVYRGYLEELKERQKLLRESKKKIKEDSERQARVVNIGFILERLVPCMDDFSFERNDCRSLFDPIDYVIFEGLSTKGAVSRIIFSDIKTGRARLKKNQKEIRDLVEAGNVEIDVYERNEKK